jgi:hypothetical protein
MLLSGLVLSRTVPELALRAGVMVTHGPLDVPCQPAHVAIMPDHIWTVLFRTIFRAAHLARLVWPTLPESHQNPRLSIPRSHPEFR